MTQAGSLDREVLSRVWHESRPYRWRVAILAVLEISGTALLALQPLFLVVVIDSGVTRGDVVAIVRAAVGLAATSLVWAILGAVSARLNSRLASDVLFDLRTSLFSHLQRQPFDFFASSRSGAMTGMIVNDTMGAASMIPALVLSIVRNAGMLAVTLVAMAIIEWRILLGMAMLCLLLIPLRFLRAKLNAIVDQLMQRRRVLMAVTTELLSVEGAELVQVSGAQAHACQLFNDSATGLRDAERHLSFTGALFGLSMGTLFGIGIAVLLGTSAAMAAAGTLSAGAVVALAALLYRLQEPVNGLGAVVAAVGQSSAAYRRIFEVLDFERPAPCEPTSPPRSGAALPTRKPAPGVDFRSVHFRYPDPRTRTLASLSLMNDEARDHSMADASRQRGVTDVSFTVARGTCTAIVGPSGSGKTTMGLLLARLYEPDHGDILIGGVNLRSMAEDDLRRQIAVVTQAPRLLNASIAENLRMGRNVSRDELEDVCRIAQIHDRVVALPHGYDTVVGESGARLSGGEKQRIAIARALLGDPSVLVFDEATAQLDHKAELNVLAAMHSAIAGRTSLVITHRPAPLRFADQIVRLDAGRVVGISTAQAYAGVASGRGVRAPARAPSRHLGVARLSATGATGARSRH